MQIYMYVVLYMAIPLFSMYVYNLNRHQTSAKSRYIRLNGMAHEVLIVTYTQDYVSQWQ